jgi:tellurite methyltransferase
MLRAIVGYVQDEAGDWVALLSCGHRQHVRHKPPFFLRPWTQSEEGRASMLGQSLDCVLCDRPPAP